MSVIYSILSLMPKDALKRDISTIFYAISRGIPSKRLAKNNCNLFPLKIFLKWKVFLE